MKRLQRISQWFLNLRISTKLLVVYALVILLPTIVLSSVLLSDSYKNIYRAALNSEQHAENLAIRIFQDRIGQLQDVTSVLTNNETIKRYMMGEYSKTSDAMYAYLTNIQPFCKQIENVDRGIEHVDLYSYKIGSINSLPYVHTWPHDIAEPSLRATIDSSIEGIWLMNESGNSWSVHYYRPIFDNNYRTAIGCMVAEVRANLLFDCFSALPEIVFKLNDSGVLFRIQNGFPVKTDYVHADKKGTVSVQTLEPLNLSFTHSFVLSNGQSRQVWILGSVVVLVCGILTILYYLLVRSSVRHLEALNQHITRSDVNHLTCLDIPVYRDEAGSLITSFNHMVVRINTLINEVYTTKLRQRDAEHYAMQAQIEPHFLFNLLENIRMEAMKNNDASTSDMIQQLGQYMHYNLNRSQTMLPLLDELTFAKRYFSIHQIRLGSRLQPRIACSTEIDDVYCPRFTLQPILENAIQHGMEGNRRLEICIDVYDGSKFGRENDVAVIVHDNGRGIPAEKLREIRQLLTDENGESASDDSHVGLKNVSERLKSLWGSDYVLRMDSASDAGTTITMFFRRNNTMVQENVQ